MGNSGLELGGAGLLLRALGLTVLTFKKKSRREIEKAGDFVMVCHGHFTEILVGAPEKPEIRPPSPPSLNFSEAHGRAQSHHCVHTVSQRLSPAVGGASYFRHCLP